MYLRKAECYNRLGNFEGMRDTARQIISLNDKIVDGHLTLACAFVEIGKATIDVSQVVKGIECLQTATMLCKQARNKDKA